MSDLYICKNGGWMSIHTTPLFHTDMDLLNGIITLMAATNE